MNNLSLLIYAADVLPSVAASLLIFSGVAVVGTTMALTISFEPSLEDEESANLRRALKPLFYLFPALFLLGLMIPSRDAIYLIAGSEIGETVVTSPEGQEVINDIREVIKAQLNALKTP